MVYETDDCTGQYFQTIQLEEGEDGKVLGYNELNPIGWNDRGRSMRIAQDLMVQACNGHCEDSSNRFFWGNTESAFQCQSVKGMEGSISRYNAIRDQKFNQLSQESSYNTVEMYESSDCSGPAYVEAIGLGDPHEAIPTPYVDFIARSIKVAPEVDVQIVDSNYDKGDKRHLIQFKGSPKCQKIPGGRNIEGLHMFQ